MKEVIPAQKDEIINVRQKEINRQTRLIGKVVPGDGHKLFELNLETFEMTEVESNKAIANYQGKKINRSFNMNVIAIIPVKGRLPLLKYTIRRLFEKNGVDRVICIGDEYDESDLCDKEGAEFIFHQNNPLGKKWNAGFQAAKKYNPDACLFVGSSDWISDNWLPTMEPYIMQHEIDMVGMSGFYLLDIGETNRFCHWPGYNGNRREEPIGIGRMLSRNILNKLNWSPVNETLNSSIDYSMFQNVKRWGGQIRIINSKDLASLSISTDRWPNMHKFQDHYSNKLPSSRMPDFGKWLDERFPEYKLIFSED